MSIETAQSHDSHDERSVKTRRLTECETDFDLSSYIVKMLSLNTFLSEISRHVRKIATLEVPTAGVMYDKDSDEFIMYWNPHFFAGLKNSDVQGVLQHEFYHIALMHTTFKRSPPYIDNVAKDLAVNSIILNDEKNPDVTLPSFACVPGKMPSKPDGSSFTDEELKDNPLPSLVARLAPGQSSHQYFQALIDECKQRPNVEMTFDVHDLGDANAGDEYMASRLNDIIARAVREADARNGWGNISSNVQRALRASVSRTVDWRDVLARFVGYSMRANKRSTLKRLNKRYPYIHSGSTASYLGRFLIAIDQSGSVDDKLLSEFFDALRSFARAVTMDVLPFDVDVDERSMFTWRRGTVPSFKRVLCGGTNFSAPTNFVNDHSRRRRWDALLILTDGEASKPIPCSIPRGWVVPVGKKLLFETNETKIVLSESSAKLMRL